MNRRDLLKAFGAGGATILAGDLTPETAKQVEQDLQMKDQSRRLSQYAVTGLCFSAAAFPGDVRRYTNSTGPK